MDLTWPTTYVIVIPNLFIHQATRSRRVVVNLNTQNYLNIHQSISKCVLLLLTLALSWPQLGHGWPFSGKSSAWIWPKTCRAFMRSSHCWMASCGNNSHDPSLHLRLASQIHLSLKEINTKLILAHMNKPEMVISINCLATAVTEILSTVIANHLIASLGPWYCHFTRWALLGITKYFLDTNKLIYHLAPFFFVHCLTEMNFDAPELLSKI